MKQAFLYILRLDDPVFDPTLVKIGITEHLSARLQSHLCSMPGWMLRAAYPFESIQEARDAESWLKAMYESQSYHGSKEVFRVNAEEADFLASMPGTFFEVGGCSSCCPKEFAALQAPWARLTAMNEWIWAPIERIAPGTFNISPGIFSASVPSVGRTPSASV